MPVISYCLIIDDFLFISYQIVVNIQKYADDILAYIIGLIIAADLPQKVAEGINQWCMINKMRLNASKCKTLIVRGKTVAPMPIVQLNNEALEEVDTYKYLGVEINNNIKWDKQWDRVQKQTKTAPYVIKALRKAGHKVDVLVNVYRCIVLSYFTYSAPLLQSASAKYKAEMMSFEKRMLKIIGISQDDARNRHNLATIEETINKTSINLLKRILADATHSLTMRLERTDRVGRSAATFKTNKANKPAYANSFVQLNIRAIRDGCSSLYTANAKTIRTIARVAEREMQASLPCTTKRTVPKIPCPICKKLYAIGAGMNNHSKTH